MVEVNIHVHTFITGIGSFLTVLFPSVLATLSCLECFECFSFLAPCCPLEDSIVTHAGEERKRTRMGKPCSLSIACDLVYCKRGQGRKHYTCHVTFDLLSMLLQFGFLCWTPCVPRREHRRGHYLRNKLMWAYR